MVKTNTFTDVTTNREYSIHSFINCNTSFVVYRLECPCGCFYIGRTKRKLKENKNKQLPVAYPMAPHYREANHGISDTLKIFGIEHVKISPRGGDRLKKLLQRESFWIYTLKANQYPGLNLELDFSPFL